MAHIPVLLKETIAVLDPKPNENFIDCTFGWGGHSRAILEKTAPGGRVIGLDWDGQSLDCYKSANPVSGRLVLENLNYANIRESAAVKTIAPINGILYDLGMSSWHIDESQKGFAFSKDEALDMRYDRNRETTAADIVNGAAAKDLERIFSEYGQERAAKKIAKAIEVARKQKKIETAGHLAAIVARIVGPAQKNSALARIFQALRIEVNRELENVEKGLAEGFEVLAPGGRMAVITFHSLEDRIVKIKFREWADSGRARAISDKPIIPGEEEVRKNPRSRSAKLRAIEKIA
jgi:16S rRNA (cytosine1402-N4)-methyltransferase